MGLINRRFVYMTAGPCIRDGKVADARGSEGEEQTMRVSKATGIAFNAVGVALFVLTTASCASNEAPQARPSVTYATASEAPVATPTPFVPAPSTDPVMLVEQAALMRCDAQGHAAYPLEFVPQRESATPQGAWEGTVFHLSYTATVTLSGATAEVPPLRQVVQVRCALEYDGAKVVVVDWSAS